MEKFSISGDWTPADDTSHRLELAPTDSPGVFALRDTYSPDQQVYATGTQIQNLAQQVQGGRLRNVIGQQGTGQQGTGRR